MLLRYNNSHTRIKELMQMKLKPVWIVFAGIMLSGPFFWSLAQSDTTKALKNKPEFYFKMKSVEKGRFLIKKLGCNDCHTNGYLKSKGNIPENKWLTGDTIGWRGPLGTSYGANLRLLIDSFKEEEWVKKAKTLKSRPPMPHPILNAMSDEDLKAIYWFIRYLGPSGKPAPAYEPHD
jgi:hypothetical protein